MKRKTLTISFGEYDEDIYEFLHQQKNSSALIRHLVRGYLSGEDLKTTPKTQKKDEEIAKNELGITKYEDRNANIEALQCLDL